MCDSNRIAHRSCIARFGPLCPRPRMGSLPGRRNRKDSGGYHSFRSPPRSRYRTAKVLQIALHWVANRQPSLLTFPLLILNEDFCFSFLLFPEGPKIKTIQDFERDWKFRARMKFSSQPPTAVLFFCGEIETSRLKFSSLKIKKFDRDWKLRARLNFVDRWALWVPRNRRIFSTVVSRYCNTRSLRKERKSQDPEILTNY